MSEPKGFYVTAATKLDTVAVDCALSRLEAVLFALGNIGLRVESSTMYSRGEHATIVVIGGTQILDGRIVLEAVNHG